MSDQNLSRRRMLRGLAVGATATGIGGTASGRNAVDQRTIPDDASVTINEAEVCDVTVDPSNWPYGEGDDGGENFDRIKLDDDATSAANAYEDFTCENAPIVEPGGSFTYEIDWSDGGFDNHYMNVWIDWKQTNKWSKAYETKLMADENDDSTTLTGTVDVPETAKDGLTLARFRLSWADFRDPDRKALGEVNDFTMNIWADRNCVDAANWPAGSGSSGYEHITHLNADWQVEESSADNAYYDFTCSGKAIAARGETMEVMIDWDDGGLDDHYANLYVDWEQNQDWSTASEYILLDNVDDDSVTGRTEFTVPGWAPTGPTLARTRLSWGGFDEPDADDLGEVNDFTIYVE